MFGKTYAHCECVKTRVHEIYAGVLFALIAGPLVGSVHGALETGRSVPIYIVPNVLYCTSQTRHPRRHGVHRVINRYNEWLGKRVFFSHVCPAAVGDTEKPNAHLRQQFSQKFSALLCACSETIHHAPSDTKHIIVCSQSTIYTNVVCYNTFRSFPRKSGRSHFTGAGIKIKPLNMPDYCWR